MDPDRADELKDSYKYRPLDEGEEWMCICGTCGSGAAALSAHYRTNRCGRIA